MARGWRGVVVAGAVLLTGSCSSDEGAAPPAGDATTTSTIVDRPDGPAAQLTVLPADGEVFMGSPEPYAADPGYVQEELTAEGTATSYAAVGELTGDGVWTLEPGEAADYRTRIVVRRPEAADDFSGTVVVEWLNVSGGLDADPEWTSLREEVVREGHAWVGVSAQLIGVEGGPVRVAVDVPGADVAGKGLKAIDPERYGALSHPGDAFANDILTQVGRAIWAGSALGELQPRWVIAAGESQSAFALVTYLNGVHPLVEVFDGYFLHSRGASSFPVLAPDDGSADITSALGADVTTIRTDLEAPVFDVQAENDVVGIFSSFRARQPDSEGFRLWEVAGTAHADRHLMGEQTAGSIDCGAPINDGPMHLVAKAAFHHLVAWVASGAAPPPSRLLEVSGNALVRDADGLALGGVRTPPVDVPVQVLSGVAGPTPATICLLSGSTLPLSPERLAERYPSPRHYEEQYLDAVDAAIEAGVVLEADRAAVEAYARPDLVAG